MHKPILTLCAVLLLAGCRLPAADAPEPEAAAPEGPDIEHLSSGQSSLPFSEAVRVGDLLFLAGKIGTVPGQGLVEGGIQAETRQVMENIKATLERYGSSMQHVAKCTVFLADIDEWGAMNEVYRTFFPTNPPARSAVETPGLALDARLEIECIAAIAN